MPKRDEETGRYTGEYDREAFLTAIRDHDGIPGTGDVASAVGCSHDTAYKRLQQLERDGAVESKKVGNTLVWRVTDGS